MTDQPLEYAGSHCQPGFDNYPGSCCCGTMALMEMADPRSGRVHVVDCGRCKAAWVLVGGRWKQTRPPDMQPETLALQRKHAREIVEDFDAFIAKVKSSPLRGP